jgi:hypothetical protein
MYVVFYLLNDWLEYIRNAAFTGRWKVKVVQFVFGWVFKSIMYHVKVFEVCLSGVAVYDVSPHPPITVKYIDVQYKSDQNKYIFLL